MQISNFLNVLIVLMYQLMLRKGKNINHKENQEL